MSVKKGLTIFIVLSMLMSGAILFFSIDASSWVIFKEADKWKLSFSVFLVVSIWLLDALKLKALTRAAGECIDYRLSLELTWINYFGAAITPMQSGGGPFQMYVMYKNGIIVGKSIAITLARTILTMLILGVTIPFSFMFYEELPRFGWGMKGFVYYIVVFCMIVWFVVVLSLLRPKIIKRWCGIVIMGLKHIGFLHPERVIRMLKRASREVDAYNENIRAFMTTGRRYFLLGTLAAFIQMWVQLSVMPCMIWALGLPVQYLECILMQALFLFMLYFIPTPGGSGAAEGGAAFVFGLFVPWNVAGVLGVAWRILTEYTGIALGVVVVMKLIGWNLADQIIVKRKENNGIEMNDIDAGTDKS